MLSSMKTMLISLITLITLSGCAHRDVAPVITTNFDPNVYVQKADTWQLVYQTTSTVVLSNPGDPQPLATFFQNQTWLTPVTTTVAIDYPYLLENTPVAHAFNQHLRELVTSEVTAFLSQVTESVDPQSVNIPHGLAITGDIVAITPAFVSANVAVSPYFSGAAHPGLYYRTINFDLDAGVSWGPEEILINPSLGLPIVQEKVIPRLVEFLNEGIGEDVPPITADEEWIRSGTAPILQNYQNMALTREGLLVQFDPYQVAAYALGAPYVTVPYSELATIINPGVLARTGLVN